MRVLVLVRGLVDVDIVDVDAVLCFRDWDGFVVFVSDDDDVVINVNLCSVFSSCNSPFTNTC